jgi:glycosyltransferase involved in cell wall biosynthesis
MMRLLIVTDAWYPQINGVVRTLEALAGEMEALDVKVDFLTPGAFRSLPCPTYPDIRLALTRPGVVRRMIEAIAPDEIHVATEGPLGLMTARLGRLEGFGFTTSYHTRFPEYLAERLPVPTSWSYRWLRRFHNTGRGCMVATETLRADLEQRGFKNLMMWPRGVDTALFHPRDRSALDHLPRPIFLNVGRVAPEKNLEAFLGLDLPGSKVVVGDGPTLPALRKRYPDVHFLGIHTGEALAALYAAADVFVFPSLTDTFGNVVIEAMASGVPVAAYPVMGPLDIVGDSAAGVLDRDLRRAALGALDCDRDAVLARAAQFSWAESARRFLDNVNAARSSYRFRTA